MHFSEGTIKHVKFPLLFFLPFACNRYMIPHGLCLFCSSHLFMCAECCFCLVGLLPLLLIPLHFQNVSASSAQTGGWLLIGLVFSCRPSGWAGLRARGTAALEEALWLLLATHSFRYIWYFLNPLGVWLKRFGYWNSNDFPCFWLI